MKDKIIFYIQVLIFAYAMAGVCILVGCLFFITYDYVGMYLPYWLHIFIFSHICILPFYFLIKYFGGYLMDKSFSFYFKNK